MEDILEFNQSALADGRTLGEICWALYLQRNPRGRSRIHESCGDEYILTSLIYVPLGAKAAGHLLASFDEVRSGSDWGAGTFSGDRQPTEKELGLAAIQGESFWNALAKVESEV
jgi:hypothetical protein